MKKLKHILNALIGILACLYLGIAILANTSVVQSFLGTEASEALSRKFGTKVVVGRVDLGFLNRLIVDDVIMFDQRGCRMLRSSRISVRLDFLALSRGRVVITSAQVFGLRANLYRQTAGSPSNFQFVLDSLASKDTTRRPPLDLQINSLVIRHGEVAYNQLDAPRKPTIDPRHLHLTGISSHIILNALRDDSVNLNVKKIAFLEASGLDVRSLSFHIEANKKRGCLRQLQANLPATTLHVPTLNVTYRFKDGRLLPSSLTFRGSIDQTYITPASLAFLHPSLKKLDKRIIIQSYFSGHYHSINILSLQAIVPKRSIATSIAAPASLRLSISGRASLTHRKPAWDTDIRRLTIDKDGISLLAAYLPAPLQKLKFIDFKGTTTGDGTTAELDGLLKSGAGKAHILASLQEDKTFTTHVKTDGFDLGQMLDYPKLGIVASDISITGNLLEKHYAAKGNVSRLDYNDYSYQNIQLEATLMRGVASGSLSADDPNLSLSIAGRLSLAHDTPAADITAEISRLAPASLHLMDGRLSAGVYSATVTANVHGRSLNRIIGSCSVRNFNVRGLGEDYTLHEMNLMADNYNGGHRIALDSDFGEMEAIGNFDYTSLWQNITNILVKKLPSIQQLTDLRYRPVASNEGYIQATITRGDWIRTLTGVPIELRSPLNVRAKFSGGGENVNLTAQAPDLTYANHQFENASVSLNASGDRVETQARLSICGKRHSQTDYSLKASAIGDKIVSSLSLDNHAPKQRLRGRLSTVVVFSKNNEGKAVAHLDVQPSNFFVGDTVFTLKASSFAYSKSHLEVRGLSLASGFQHINIDGATTKGKNDSLVVDLKNIDVNYVLDLVNFHSVAFGGKASGAVSLSQLFDNVQLRGKLLVNDFSLIGGRLGTLHANVGWNSGSGQVDIQGMAVDTTRAGGATREDRLTSVDGYVSIKRNYIDLGIGLKRSRVEFLETLCPSLLNHVDASGDGALRLWGDLKRINLTGDVQATGSMGITPLGTRYSLSQAPIRLIENEIQFQADTIVDRYGGRGILNGSIRHHHLSRLSYNLHVDAHDLLAFDQDAADGSSFYGTVFGTGTADIKGHPGEVDINVSIMPNDHSEIVYNASKPEAISSQSFIQWSSRDSVDTDTIASDAATVLDDGERTPDDVHIPTDIRLNLLVNATPEATLRLIMNQNSGDYITLNGTGTLRASYYNKGGVQVFGNYLIDHGVYKLTVQNVIKRDFLFTQGGTIAFGGDPYQAIINLQAKYSVASVSLADLEIGRSFSGNNIRVDCLMNITGTPAAPKVEFGMDMPTVGTDAKQMIYSVINSEEEMNQQVLYLLAVGRFYSLGRNNANTGNADNQTSLAMQSILSGQLSQQINNVLGNVVKNSNWNFGANISTGDEGWNNAEYEGLLSGRLLNNRLLFDGQFGYRDNPNATTSFIGDFDVRYLIFPNGNLSIHVYNQANDRYFTRNSLNTQGLGFILKKDFNGWRDLLGIKRKKHPLK